MKNRVIQTVDLTKTFQGGVVGVSGLSFQVQRGSVYGLIGPNGAGKTTAIRLLMGLLRPDHGTVRVLGADLMNAPCSVRSLVGYVSQSQQLPSWMTLAELCRYAAHFYDRWDSGFASHLAHCWRLPESRPVGQFSSGEQRKAAILLALAPRPQVLLLDEPGAGLDPVARRELVDALVDLIARGDGATILFSSHIISDVERIADCVGIIDRGRLVAGSRLDELQTRMRRIQIIFPGDSPPPGFSVQGCLRFEVSGSVVTAVTQCFDPDYVESLREKPGVRVQVFPIGLEEIFIELIGHINRGASVSPLSNELEN
ncbi:MAG: ABC transporter ATP-binding protein [Verrucomicrobia bacterium]|nr:ABC transporter ATP-binding protein [Verrucomicrobiota bacterium]